MVSIGACGACVVSIGACGAFLSRRAARSNSRGQKEAVNDSRCDRGGARRRLSMIAGVIGEGPGGGCQ